MTQSVRSEAIVYIPDVHTWIDDLTPELLPRHNDDYPGKNVVLSGSFSNWERIVAVREQFHQLGYWPLAPSGNEIIRLAGSFGILDKDAGKLDLIQHRLGRELSEYEAGSFLEALFLRAIRAADFCYLVGAERNEIDDGLYVGTHVSFEMAYAQAYGKPIFASGDVSPTLERGNYYEGWLGPHALVQASSPQEIMQALAV